MAGLDILRDLGNGVNKSVNGAAALSNPQTPLSEVAGIVALISGGANLASAVINKLDKILPVGWRSTATAANGLINIVNLEVQIEVLNTAIASGNSEQITQSSLDFASSVAGVIGLFPGVGPEGKALAIVLSAASSAYKNREEIAQFLEDALSISSRTSISWRDLDPNNPHHLDAIEAFRKKFGTAKTIISPIVFDLNGDGINTSSLQYGAYFDHDANGFAERTGWINRNDGLLVRDLNSNGSIDTGRELFGSETLLASGQEAPNGYEALAELDANHDGQVDAQDAAFADLRLWKDVNGDGQSSADELLTLADAGVQSLATGYANVDQTDANGNTVKQSGTFTKTDGSTGASADIWFPLRQDSCRLQQTELYRIRGR